MGLPCPFVWGVLVQSLPVDKMHRNDTIKRNPMKMQAAKVKSSLTMLLFDY